MMSNTGRQSTAAGAKQIGIGVLCLIALVMFVLAYVVGESRAEKRAAKISELSNSRLDIMRERLDVCKEEQLALRKGEATSESTLKTMRRSKEILAKEISMLEDTIRVDRQGVNDCIEEADAERRARTGTTQKDAKKALADIKAEEARLTKLLEDAKAAGPVGGGPNPTRLLRRLTRAYAMENKALSLQLSGLLGGNTTTVGSPSSPASSAAEEGKAAEEEGSSPSTSEPAMPAFRMPSKDELRALLLRGQRLVAKDTDKKRRRTAGRKDDARQAVLDALADDEEEDEAYIAALGDILSGKLNKRAAGSAVEAVGGDYDTTNKKARGSKDQQGSASSSSSSSSSFVLDMDKGQRFEALIEDMEEGLGALQGNVAMPQQESAKLKAAQAQKRVQEEKAKQGSAGGLQPRRRGGRKATTTSPATTATADSAATAKPASKKATTAAEPARVTTAPAAAGQEETVIAVDSPTRAMSAAATVAVAGSSSSSSVAPSVEGEASKREGSIQQHSNTTVPAKEAAAGVNA